MSDTLRRLWEMRRESEHLRKLEETDNKEGNFAPLWLVSYGKTATNYEENFGKLIEELLLKQHLVKNAIRFRKKGLKYCVFDPFAPLESFLKKIQKPDKDGNLPIDGGVASTLSDPRDPILDKKEIERDTRRNLYCVPGDISMPGPRNELYGYMKELGIEKEGFGAVFIRPLGGLEMIGANARKYVPLYYSFFRKLWPLVSNNDGEVFCSVSYPIQGSDIFHKWINLMRDDVHADVYTTIKEGSMRVVKHKKSKEHLPGLKELGLL